MYTTCSININQINLRNDHPSLIGIHIEKPIKAPQQHFYLVPLTQYLFIIIIYFLACEINESKKGPILENIGIKTPSVLLFSASATNTNYEYKDNLSSSSLLHSKGEVVDGDRFWFRRGRWRRRAWKPSPHNECRLRWEGKRVGLAPQHHDNGCHGGPVVRVFLDTE